MSASSNSSGGVGFTGLLFIVFLILKLTHTISWSWVWVFAPLWVPLVVCLGAVCIFGLCYWIYKFIRSE